MLKGMTGFGNALISSGEVKGIIEVKSLNHRYFDIVFYLPVGFASLENRIRTLIQRELKRGRISVSLKITEKVTEKPTINKTAVREYLKYGRTLAKEFALKNDLTIADLIRLPGVVDVKEIFLDPDRLWPAIEKALKASLGSLVAMREREGKTLAKDILDLMKRMTLQIKKIEARTTAILKEKKKVLSDDEMVSFQKSADIAEELTRLAHFIDEVKLLIASEVNAGKKLDFIAQEMQRETNTIGSKVQDKIVSNAVISLKSKVEKLREQAQNIE